MVYKDKIAFHIIEIISQLQNAGFETYIVGGAVRDILLGTEPKDYDISTSATPEQIRLLFGKRKARIIGRRFKLVHYYHGHHIVEISTFRKNPLREKQKSKDGKPPELIWDDNEFGSPSEDAWRRDFTVNAIFYDPCGEKTVDFTGSGIKDLNGKSIRAIGNPVTKFAEDPVRMLRGLKLVGQYGFTLERETEEAMCSQIRLINHASNSRLELELEKILKKPYSDKILVQFRKYGLLSHFLPFIDSIWGTSECEYMLELLAERNSRLLKGYYRDSLSLALATMALPFVEFFTGAEKSGDLWHNFFGFEKALRDFLRDIFAPHHFPKKVLASAQTALILQPGMFKMENRSKLIHNPKYHHARELMTLQNNVKWRNAELEYFWPVHSKRP